MPTLAQIVSDRATATLGEGDAALHMDYSPQATRTPFVADLVVRMGHYDQESATPEEALGILDDLAAALADLLISWDMLESDEQTPMPITEERLRRIGGDVLALLFGAIMRSARDSMGEANGTRSLTPTPSISSNAARSIGSRAASSRRK